MRRLSFCLVGGTGFIGRHLAARLVREGHAVRILTRRRAGHPDLAVLPGLELVEGNPYHAATLAEAFRGQDVVIHLVGILNEAGRNGAGFERAHLQLTREVVAAARAAHVPRLLHMSALHANEHGPSHYLRTKALAERVVREECGDVDWTIFQPSVVFGPGDSFINRFAQLLRLLPVMPLARAGARFQPVWVDDVVAAFYRAAHDDKTVYETYQLCGPEVYTLRDIVTFVRDQLGLRRLVFGIPDFIGRLQAAVMDFVPGKPLSTDNFKSLTVDSVATENGFARLAISPASMRAVVPGYLGGPHSVERHARYAKFRGQYSDAP